MNDKKRTTVERIIGKIDNEFNLDNSDWIPRCAAYIIDALNSMKIEVTTEVAINSPVEERIASLQPDARILYITYNDCRLTKLTKDNYCCYSQDVYHTEVNNVPPNRVINNDYCRGYFELPNDQIELTFDAEEVIVTYLNVKTYYSEAFNCDLPVIPDNGLLIEALTWYCIMKIMSRGTKHPVYGLNNPEPTNPYSQWMLYRPRAIASVINFNSKSSDDSGAWNSYFYNQTFR